MHLFEPRPDCLGTELHVCDLGSEVPYADGLARQHAAVAARQSGDSATETLFLLEHSPVYTLGRNADATHVLWNRQALAQRGIEVAETERGGDVTFHGPGQLVGYPVLNVGKSPRVILPYVNAIEEVLLGVAARFGIKAERNRRNRGIWVGNAKLAAIGVRVTGGVTSHGFALNVTTDLSLYGGIVPCGIADAGVTSMAALLPSPPSMAEVKTVTAEIFSTVFGFD